MGKGRSSWKCYVAVMISLWFTCANSATNDENLKFIFPEHLRGVNYSHMEELDEYNLKYDPVLLGGDITDEIPPKLLLDSLVNATLSSDASTHQYTDADGLLALRQSIAKLYSKLINRKLDPQKNIVISAGATGAVYSAFHGHTTPGDEWIVIEPAFTTYVPVIKMAKGIPRYTYLKLRGENRTNTSSDWHLDRKELTSLFNKKTKGILINNPHNPTGKVYTYEELTFIANLVKKWNAIVICDEAHEWATYKPHIRIATLPGMFEQTITIGTASKTFGVSGWRVGWSYGPAALLNHLKTMNERTIVCSPSLQQAAIAHALDSDFPLFGKPNSYFVSHLKQVKKQRDFIVQAFRDSGMDVIVPDGGHCMLVKWTNLKNIPVTPGEPNSCVDFVKWMIMNVRVLGYGLTSYYTENKHFGADYVRYCYHKKEETLKEAAKQLKSLRSYL